MASNPSKPSSEADFSRRTLGIATNASTFPVQPATAAHPFDKQPTPARQSATLTGRGNAPTGAPMEAKAPMGVEGSLSAWAQAREVGAPALLARMQGLRRLRGFLPRLEWWRVDVHTGWPIGAHLVLREGLFVYAKPVQLAMLFPWFKE